MASNRQSGRSFRNTFFVLGTLWLAAGGASSLSLAAPGAAPLPDVPTASNPYIELYKRWLAAGGASSLSLAAPGAAPLPDAPTAGNPYIELYKLRIEQAEANVRRQEALVELARSKLARGRILIGQNAMSREEYETLVSDAAVTTADVDLTRKKVDEAKAYYQIIEGMVKRRVNIPLCTYEME